MEKTVFQIQIRIFLPEMIRFYKDNPEYGTLKKPYPADSFYQLISSYAKFYGPMKNILIFQNNCIYNWIIESADGTPLEFNTTTDEPEMDMEMMTNKPSNAKWKKLFDNAPDMLPSGKVKVKSIKTKKNEFELETSSDVADGGSIKYSFLFKFKDEKEETKYGIIDPIGGSMPPPPYD